jgi:alkanesulfonate monooxygenase SsuD/methylene tetrahydromethanopterin reductase-like flavin-dependent oxidoreductase (luciferase family)
MDFGTLIFPKPDICRAQVALVEQRGFTHAWIPDSHMIWGDAYACMALAAAASSRIKLGTGVAIASNRIAPVTVHSIATVNQIAPGRVILGFGTGHTARRIMGLPPVKFAEFRMQVRAIAEMLRTGETVYRSEGLERKIRFLHRKDRFINLDDRIPFYVAGNGPQTIALAGEFGDGLITTGVGAPDRLARIRKNLEAGAKKAGRELLDFPIVSLTHACVLKEGEALDSPRVAAMTGHWVMANYHAIAAGYASAESLPGEARPIFEEYRKQVEAMRPPDERYLRLHEGHCQFVAPDERRFVTPAGIRATTLIGTGDELIAQLKSLEKSGLRQIFLNPPMEGFEESVEDFAREVIARY